MKKYILFAITLLGIVACGSDEIGGGDAPVVSKDYINVISKVDFMSEDGNTKIEVSASCDWVVSKDADWVSVSPTSGSKNQSITVTVLRNYTENDRTATITVKGIGNNLEKKISVTQAKTADSSLVPSANDNQLPE